MKPRLKLAESKTPSGGVMGLYEQDGAFSINIGGQELMHSKANASECLLGSLGMARVERQSDSRVLVGGLGLGFTLRNVLKAAGSQSQVMVVELFQAVVDWNRTHLQELNGELLDDPRVQIKVEDVVSLIRDAEPESFDVILLDIDNGPIAMVDKNNRFLYSKSGLGAIRRMLKPNGRVVFWSAGPDKHFERRLQKTGFQVKAEPAKRYLSAKRAACTLYVADQSSNAPDSGDQ
jgi:spermidine synthase